VRTTHNFTLRYWGHVVGMVFATTEQETETKKTIARLVEQYLEMCI